MMEEGFIKLILADTTVLTLTPSGGGFYVQLPKGTGLPSWTYQVISDQSDTALNGETGLAMTRIQIDVFGDPNGNGLDCLTLAKAIDNTISGLGNRTLDDEGPTYLSSISRSNKADFFDSSGRSFRRMLEYEVWSN